MNNLSDFTMTPFPTFGVPTLAQLRARRLECLQYALAMYRREHACHVRDTINREEWAKARLYWTQQAYHAHGEIQGYQSVDRFTLG